MELGEAPRCAPCFIQHSPVPAVPAGHKAQLGLGSSLGLWASDAGPINTHKEPDRTAAGAAGARAGHGRERPPSLGHRNTGERADLHHGGGRAGQPAGDHLGVSEPKAEEPW